VSRILHKKKDRRIIDCEDVGYGSFVDDARRTMRAKRQSEVQ
jgi:hypothetical protein